MSTNKHTTQGWRKLSNYLDALFLTNKFKKDVRHIRKICNIEIDPVNFNPNNSQRIVDARNFSYDEKINQEIINLCNKYGLSVKYFYIPMVNYLRGRKDNYIQMSLSDGLCAISWKDSFDVFRFGPKIDDSFPVSINISPYASERDVIDFVKKTYTKHIKPLQDAYRKDGIKLSRIKTRVKQKRNEYIYNNKNLRKSELMLKVQENFNEFLDYSEIGKIISLEKQRRKKL